eukprot:scaffold44717_cov65-Cyclotella_meneghiniana.AAC.3
MAELQASTHQYEQSKDDPIECHQAWSSTTNNDDDESNKSESLLESWAQSHNEGISHHLSTLRRRRMRRARPSSSSLLSKQHGNDEDDLNGNNDLMNVLSKNLNDLPTTSSSKHHNENDGYDNTKIDSINNYNASLVVTYNMGLVHYSSGNIDEALRVILPKVNDVMAKITAMSSADDDGKPQDVSDESGSGARQSKSITITATDGLDRVQVVIVRLLFLVLDCVIRKHEGDGIGITSLISFEKINNNDDNGEEETKSMLLDPRDIIAWMENNINRLTGINTTATTSSSTDDGDEAPRRINTDELKFRLHIYKSKFLFIGSKRNVNNNAVAKQNDDNNNNNNNDEEGDNDNENNLATRTRISRKELKSAMDIYQNKLSVEKTIMDHDNNNNNKYGNNSNYNNDGSYMEKTKSTTTTMQNKQTKGGNTNNNGKPTKSKGSNTSDVSSVTSMAGGSFVSEGVLWNSGSGSGGGGGNTAGIVASATFEGMPHKTMQTTAAATATSSSQQHQKQQQQQVVAKKKDHPELHVQHEAALYLKANLECLRGNTTKSLKLCSEARLAGKRSQVVGVVVRAHDDNDDLYEDKEKDGSPSSESIEEEMANCYDEAIYYNNLALVHQSAGKLYLALHYSSLALESASKVTQLDNISDNQQGKSYFWSDGIARPDITAEILYNTSTCALQAGEFEKAHECMAKCIDVSPNLFAKRPRSWLYMGQSCLGEKLTFLLLTAIH